MLEKKKGWAWLGVLTWNTHMGNALTSEMWEWMQDFLPRIHVIMFQEVASIGKLRQVLGGGWIVVPLKTPDKGRGTTFLAVRAKRFKGLAIREDDIRFGSRHSRQIIAVDGVDRKTGRFTLLGSLHTDPLGLGFESANIVARRRHERQTNAWAVHIRDWYKAYMIAEPVVVLAGDGNERLDMHVPKPLGDRTIKARFAEVELKPAFRAVDHDHIVRLDDVWTKGKDVRVVRRIQFKPGPGVAGARHLDHDLVYALLSIKKAQP